MTETTKKCYSRDEENYNSESLGELIDNYELVEGDHYWEADAIAITHKDFLDVDYILENFDEQGYEEVGEVYDNDFINTPKEAKDELEELIKGWAEKHVNLRYWKVRNSKEFKITKEDLE